MSPREIADLPLVLPGQTKLKLKASKAKRRKVVKTLSERVRPTDRRYTPESVLDLVRGSLGILGYDPCTEPHNPAGAASFSALPENGLQQNWRARARGRCVWVNPPFSMLLDWANACALHARMGAEVALLTPVDPSTGWYDILVEHAAVASQLRDRVKFVMPDGEEPLKNVAMQPTMLWYFGSRVKAWIRGVGDAAHHFAPGVLR